MSTNNELIILKGKHKKEPFEVHENFCVDNDFFPVRDGEDKTFIKGFKTLIQAIRFAKERCNEYLGVEYGFTILDSALVDALDEGGESK